MEMCTPQCIFDKLGGLAFDEAVKQGKYVLHYAKNFENLQDEMRKLDDRREYIHKQVCEAIDHGKEIMPDVKTWLTEADRLKNDVDQLKAESSAKGNKHCIACSCPNIKWRYRLSKHAEKMIQDVKDLTEKGHFEEIAHRRPPPPELEALSNENYVNFDSRRPIFDNIVHALEESIVNMIGVYGPGGVGKTTLALEVAEKMRRDGTFKQVSRATIPKGLTMEEIQSQLADGLNFKFDPNTDKMGSRTTQLWIKLTNGEKYLIILDDIWEKLDIKAIGIPITDVNRKCKVLLTSRDKDLLLIKMKVDYCFAVAKLPEQEALDLFEKKVRNSFESDIAHAVCKRCQGLPLAINVIGAALEGKPAHVSRDALVKLERYELMDIEGIHPSVWASLRLSYDFLSPIAKSCFLLCCLFREDAEIPIGDLIRHCLARRLLSRNPHTLEEASYSVFTAIEALKSASLLLDGSDKNFVRIHDMIRDVGITIAREEKAFYVEHGALHWPENPIDGPPYSAISLIAGRIQALPTNLTCPKLHTLMFENRKHLDLEVPDEFFSEMTQLLVLILTGMRMRQLPSSFGKLAKLRMLFLIECHLADISVLGDLNKELEVLRLRGSIIKALSPISGQLTSLRVLDLEECKLKYLFSPNTARGLIHLEQLQVKSCEIMEGVVGFEGDGNQHIGEVKFVKLKQLKLENLPNLISFYAKKEKTQTTMGSSSINAQPLFNEKLAFPALEDLTIWNVPNITEIWDEKLLPESEKETQSFCKLRDIDVRNCNQLVYVLPSYMLPQLQINLQRLQIVDCEEVEVIVSKELKEKEATDNDIIVFHQLKVVRFWNLHKLKSFYTGTELLFDKVTFPRLENLELYKCESLRCIFQLSMARVLVNLQELIIHDCSKMEIVVDGEEEIEDGQGRKSRDKTLFPHLSKLELRRLPELRWFCHFRYPLELPLLSQMVIEFCPKFNSFASGSVSSSAHAQMALFNDKVILPGLEDLLVLALDRIEEIWDKQSPLANQETVSFGQLKNMTVKSCRKLTNLFPSTILPRLQNLQTLLVDGCPNVEFVVFKNEKGEGQAADDSTLIIPQLRHLRMWNMEKLKSFYSSTTTSNAESLFNHQVTCPGLENLELEECKSLRCIFQPSMASVLVNLQELIINDCSKMEAVFDREEEIEDGQGRNSTNKTLLPHLRKLELRCLPGLRRFCHFRYPVELPLLSQMVILGCRKMNSLSLGQVSTPNLALQEGGEIIAPSGLELASIMDWEDFHSRHKVFNGIVEALKDPEVNMIVVYGARGVGKTTMVDVVGERMEKDGIFDEVIKAVVSYDANVRKIQGQLANSLNLMLQTETEMGIAKQLWNRLDNGKKNLILLDDVWQELDLKIIGIPITEQNKRCKVVITSQNRDVWKNMDVHKDFKIEFLSEEEAWTLFKKVGNVDLNDQPLCDIAWAICKDCEGLPLAVKAFAVALRGKDMNAWQDALGKLNKSMLRDIEGINRWLYGPLRWSYDRLDYEDAKSCFLLCCLFSEDAEILVDGLVRYYMVWGPLDRKPDTLQRGLYRVRKLVDTLKSQGLLLDGNSEDSVKMHAVMRHVSTSIANNDKSFFVDHHVKQWPAKATYEHCSVISLRPNDMRKFPNELVCPKLHTLRLDYTGNKSHAQVPDKFFSGMENLTILDLKRVTPPASLAKLAKLKMLRLEGCNLGDIAILKNLNDHLEILSLRGSNIEVLPSEVGELTRLRLLDMADCKELGMIPKGVISKLFLLEELYMPWNFRQWEGMTDERQINCVSLDELMALTRLTTLHIYIPDTALLLKDFTFENLVRFRISFGGEGFLGNWSPGDGALVLENIHIANALERLLGMQRNGLHPSTSFDHLTSLSFRDCRVKYLFSPSRARGLVQLKYLTVESCTVMEGVIGTEGEEKDEDEVIIFKLLKYLHLEGLPNLISFYHGKEKTATSSESSSAHARMVLFNDKVIFPTLEILELEGCESLRYIFQPSRPRGLVKLQELIINDCSKMEAVFNGEEEINDGQGRKSTDKTPFPHLSKLELRRLPKLRWFCQFRYPLEMPLLSQMVIEVCPRLNSFSSGSVNSSAQAQMVLFNDKVTFPRLENLELDGCESLRCIFQLSMARVLVNLQQLIIHDCSKMEAVVDGEEEIEDGQGRKSIDKTLFPHLNKLELRRLQELRWFCHFRYPLELPLLSQMVIEVCPRLNSFSSGSVSSSAHVQMVLFNDQVTFPRLENLELEGCGSLKYIFQPSIARILVSLQELIINNCSKIVAVVGGEEQIEDGQGRESTDKTLFPHLITLELRCLPELWRFCYFRYPLELPLLSQMVIEVCPRLNSIFSSGSVSSSAHAQMVLFNDKVTFPRLENLEIEGCESLNYTFQPSMARVLVNLQKLIINDCSKMEAVVGGEEEIEDGQGRKSTDKTLFPHLSKLELRHLPELRRFCHFRYPVELPLLSQMVIEVCPRMNSFSSGSVSTPNLFARFVSYDFVGDDTTVTEEE